MKTITETFRGYIRLNEQITRLLESRMEGTGYSLPEARILSEILALGECPAKSILRTVKINKGHLSRLLLRMKAAGTVNLVRSVKNKRFLRVSLTEAGRAETLKLQELMDRQSELLLDDLATEELSELQAAMDTITRLLREPEPPTKKIVRHNQATPSQISKNVLRIK